MTYGETQIKSVLALLNQISVKGIDNCQRICMIEQILQNPIMEGKDGECNKEKSENAG